MAERATKWQPMPNIDSSFGSISYSFQDDRLVLRMIGSRVLVLDFAGVVAFRFEQECPGFDPLPHPLPLLRASQTFPLLLIEESRWLEQFSLIYKDCRHFALITSDHLVQLIAKPNVDSYWEETR
jgi:hypothetical protein